MRHVRNAEGFVAFDGSVDDIDGVAAQHQVDERSAGALPALDLVLAHRVDEIVLLARIELREPAAAVRSGRGMQPVSSATDVSVTGCIRLDPRPHRELDNAVRL